MSGPLDSDAGARSIAPLFTWRSAIAESDLPSTTRHVALALSLYMNERGGSAFPGAVRLARDTALTDRAVRSHLQRLVDDGWLELVHRGGREGERRAANHYVARVPTPEPRSEVVELEIERTPEPGSGVPLNLNALTPEPRSPQLTSDYTRDLTKNASGANFDAFWSTYPRRVGKRNALAAWEKATKRADPELIVAGAERYALDPNRDPAYTAHPTTWLNGDRWDDDPLPSRTGSTSTRTQRGFDAIRNFMGPTAQGSFIDARSEAM